jgi:hypothetical protein
MQDCLRVIRCRHSTRGAFDLTRSISTETRELILDVLNGCLHRLICRTLKLLLWTPRSSLMLSGVPADMSEQFLLETFGLLSYSDSELHEKKTGMVASFLPLLDEARGMEPRLKL